MNKRVLNPKPPVRLYSKRESGEFIENDIWFCGECNLLTAGHHTEAAAALCCKTVLCACGKEVEYRHHSRCSSCQNAEWHDKERAKFDAMEVVTYNDEAVVDGDDYYETMDEFLDHLYGEEEQDWPMFVQICRSDPLGSKMSAAHIWDYVSEQLTEDFEDPDAVDIVGGGDFRKACEDFLAQQTYTTWHPINKKVAVPLDQLRKDVAAMNESKI